MPANLPPNNYDATEYEIRLRPDARDRMHAAAREAGERMPSGHHGNPSGNALIRKASGTARNLFTVGAQPHNTSLARIAVIHAERRGIDPFDALRELCEIVPVAADAMREAVAA